MARRQDMKFKAENDTLRREDAKFYNYGTAIEREKQLIDKRRNIEYKIISYIFSTICRIIRVTFLCENYQYLQTFSKFLHR